MTSSYKATGTASVRRTASIVTPKAGAWALDELAFPAGAVANPETSKPDLAATADERARLIDEAFARGMAEGERKTQAAAQAQVDEALSLIGDITTRLQEVASLAPGVLEDNVAALAVIVARQIVSREISLDRA